MIEPERFGVDPHALWSEPASADDRYRVMASYQQHLAAIAVLEPLEKRASSPGPGSLSTPAANRRTSAAS